MDSNVIRQKFLDFFASKDHSIVPSAPMIIKDDPTLMFTNAGMNQFKDIFLDQRKPDNLRVADTQKCLRVSGKHNDLEEVGRDTYHHTMFEMLGNWSFGDYFKKEAIDWAWEFLVDELKISKEHLYASIFEGSREDQVEMDNEAFDYWKQYLPEDHILKFGKKDNFWEMGDTGPCGPCSEIHIDLRSDAEKNKVKGADLINKDHPRVIEIWNLVFIQYNRKSNGELVTLPKKHIDTGMGFERLCMVVQQKNSNYDTDIFQPVIKEISKLVNIEYGHSEKTDIAMRVVADHLRAVVFAVADSQLPSNTKAGYVIRRILRRAIRYYYSFLEIKEPLIYKLLDTLIDTMGNAFPELVRQRKLIEHVIRDEEVSFLHTLSSGIKMLEGLIHAAKSFNKEIISGKKAFELYDTFGFPLDLTELILREEGLTVNKEEFNQEMKAQKERSRKAAEMDTGDWQVLEDDDVQEFIGYDYQEASLKITRYRKISTKNKNMYQLVFNITPFYGESGGQVGDTGYIENDEERIQIFDSKKENNITVHYVEKLPSDLTATFKAVVDREKRIATANNHTATHLLHYALRKVLGKHVEQRGSLVHPDYLRFDFSHFQKVSDDQLHEIEILVNRKIRENAPLEEFKSIPIAEAQKMGAMALFGEKYGDLVRVLKYNDSIELCGGTHVPATGQIGFMKIISESSIAAGVRRIQAYTAEKAEEYIDNHLGIMNDIIKLLDGPSDIRQKINELSEQNAELQKKIDKVAQQEIKRIKNNLKENAELINDINVVKGTISAEDSGIVKDLAFQMRNEMEDLFLILGAEINGKAHLTIMLSDNLVKNKKLHAGLIIKEIAGEIDGGGGGQPFYATAGGSNPKGIDKALDLAVSRIKSHTGKE